MALTCEMTKILSVKGEWRRLCPCSFSSCVAGCPWLALFNNYSNVVLLSSCVHTCFVPDCCHHTVVVLTCVNSDSLVSRDRFAHKIHRAQRVARHPPQQPRLLTCLLSRVLAGIPLDMEWVTQANVNLASLNRRCETHAARRSVKMDWQTAWLLRAVTCIDL